MEIGIIGYLTQLTQRIRVLDPLGGPRQGSNRLCAKQTHFGEFGEFPNFRFQISDFRSQIERQTSSREPACPELAEGSKGNRPGCSLTGSRPILYDEIASTFDRRLRRDAHASHSGPMPTRGRPVCRFCARCGRLCSCGRCTLGRAHRQGVRPPLQMLPRPARRASMHPAPFGGGISAYTLDRLRIF